MMTSENIWIPVESDGDPVRLHAWLFRPDGDSGPRPAITMAHGFAGLKDRGLRGFAERFAKAGFIVVVHDHRGFGASGGVPRGDIDPWRQIADWRRVISFLEAIDGVDTGRIGLWGSSYAGGHSLFLGATDPRIKVVVAQVPTISGYLQSLRRVTAEARRAMELKFADDDRAQLAGEPPAIQRVVSLDPNVAAAYRSRAMIDYHQHFPLQPGVDPSETVTLRSTQRAWMYEPGDWVTRIGPKPLLMVVGSKDVTTPVDLALGAYEQAHEPKKLVFFEGEHFDAYISGFEVASSAAEHWFVEHLRPGAEARS
jgi:fermentation-respiration switch protein FrsA (DUF1100 family)